MNGHPWAPPGFEITLSKRWFQSDGYTYAGYARDGGYAGLRKVLDMQPDEIIDHVKRANLRGRGGAGFPTGMKWGFVPKESKVPKYLVVNADESEPGTYKDRYILSRDPHLLLEGCAIGARAIGANTVYIYIRGEFGLPYRRLEAAVREAYEKGVFGASSMGSGYKIECIVHRGAGAYICGEETALLESLEGKIGRPRLKPPFPAVKGAFGGPTSVNNVETIACVPLIFQRGVDWFNAQGVPGNGGPKLMCVSGHIEQPGIYEIPNGYSGKKFLELCGGVWKGRKLKGMQPGGSSTNVLAPVPCKALASEGTPQSEWPLETDAALDLDSLKKAGSALGSAGMMVFDDHTCMVRSLSTLANFYAHESCGQCTPCREGTGWVAKILQRLERGEGTDADIAKMMSATDYMMGMTICVLADSIAMPVKSFFDKYREEFIDHVRHHKCSFGHPDATPAPTNFWEDATAERAS